MIKGKNIRLRVIEREDLPVIRSWFNNPDLRGMEGIFLPVSAHEMEKKYADMLKQNKTTHFLIERIDGSKILGKCTLYHGHAGVDLLMPEQDTEYEEAALEALDLCLSGLLLEHFNKNCVSMWIPSWNEWLVNLAEKAGLKPAGRSRRTGMRDGKYYDHIVLDILKEEFLTRTRKNSGS